MKSLEDNLNELKNSKFVVTGDQNGSPTAQAMTKALSHGIVSVASFLTSSGYYNGPASSSNYNVLSSGGINSFVYDSDEDNTNLHLNDRLKEMSFEDIHELFGDSPFISIFVDFFQKFSTQLVEMGFNGKTPEEALEFLKDCRLIYKFSDLDTYK